MGIYGMGNAFNLRYQPKQQISFGRRPMPQPMMMPTSSYSNTTNITYKSGMNNFWSFMSGLTQGILGSGVLEMLNKKGDATTQTKQENEIDRKGNLQKMYSQYTVLENSENSFTLTDGKGHNIKTGTYEELIKGLDIKPEGDKPEVQDKPEPEKEEIDPKYKNGLSAKDAAALTAGTEVTFKDDAEGGGRAVTGFKIKTVGEEKTTEGYPKTYTFERDGKTITATFVKIDNGEAVYKAGNDEYRLEKVGDQIQFNQHSDDTLTGTGQINTKWNSGNFE